MVHAEDAVDGCGRILTTLKRRHVWILHPAPIEVVVAARREPRAKAPKALQVCHRDPSSRAVGFAGKAGLWKHSGKPHDYRSTSSRLAAVAFRGKS